ncbi:MAG: alpha/beta hydrolase [Gammaproteobacteria bacterium]|nr:alpha/beta hydrolase [Gammaproteobacteria bacterium]
MKESGVINVDGAALSYSIDGHGPPVLIIGSTKYYQRTFSKEFRTWCRCGFLDLRYFAEPGTSCSADRITLDDYVDDIEKFCSATAFGQFVLLGHSHHGNVALEYAKRHPARVSHLVLVGTPPCNVSHTLLEAHRYWDAQASESRRRLLSRNLEALRADKRLRSSEETYVAEYVADGPRYWYDPSFDATHLWEGVPVNLDMLKAFRQFFVDYSFKCGPTDLHAPVLVVQGRNDYAVPPTLWTELLPRLPNVDYHVFEGSGHTPQLEEGRLFDTTFLRWLHMT